MASATISAKHIPVEDRTRGIVRIVQHDHFGAGVESSPKFGDIRLERGCIQGDGPMDATGQSNGCPVGIVKRFEGDDLVTGLDERQDRGGNSFGGTRCDNNFGVRINR